MPARLSVALVALAFLGCDAKRPDGASPDPVASAPAPTAKPIQPRLVPADMKIFGGTDDGTPYVALELRANGTVWNDGSQIGVVHDDTVFGSKGETLASVDPKGNVTFTWDTDYERAFFDEGDVLVFLTKDSAKTTCRMRDGKLAINYDGSETHPVPVEGVTPASQRLICLAAQVYLYLGHKDAKD